MTISKWKVRAELKERCTHVCIVQEEDLRRALVDALRRGHVDFVELLIEFGTSLEKLTHADLNNLYTTISVRIGPRTAMEESWTGFFSSLEMDCRPRAKEQDSHEREKISTRTIFVRYR
jgi:hypothetical protein